MHTTLNKKLDEIVCWPKDSYILAALNYIPESSQYIARHLAY